MFKKQHWESGIEGRWQAGRGVRGRESCSWNVLYETIYKKKKRTLTEGVIWGAFHPPRALKSLLIPSNEELKLSAMFIFYEVPYRPGIRHQRKATGCLCSNSHQSSPIPALFWRPEEPLLTQVLGDWESVLLSLLSGKWLTSWAASPSDRGGSRSFPENCKHPLPFVQRFHLSMIVTKIPVTHFYYSLNPLELSYNASH